MAAFGPLRVLNSILGQLLRDGRPGRVIDQRGEWNRDPLFDGDHVLTPRTMFVTMQDRPGPRAAWAAARLAPGGGAAICGIAQHLVDRGCIPACAAPGRWLMALRQAAANLPHTEPVAAGPLK